MEKTLTTGISQAEPRGPHTIIAPEPHAALLCEAGASLTAAFAFVNDSPDVAVFALNVAGLPGAEWIVYTDAESRKSAAPAGTGTLQLQITPPRSAAVGEYDLVVQVASGGYTVREIPLTLGVTPARAPASDAPYDYAPSAAFAAPMRATAAASDPVSPVSVGPVSSAPNAPANAGHEQGLQTPVVSAAPSVSALGEDASGGLPPTQAKNSVSQGVNPAAAQGVNSVSHPARQDNQFADAPINDTPVQGAQPVRHETTAQTFANVSEPVTPTAAKPPVRPVPAAQQAEVLPIVDLSSPAASNPDRHREEDDDDDEDAQGEMSLRNPDDGTRISLRPGESRLIRFGFTNDNPREQTYVLDEDGTLGTGWISLVQDQVNLTRNGSGDLLLRVHPPLTAEPGEYYFSVTLGPLGGIMSTRQLTLGVLATPAVRVLAEQPLVTVGPFSRHMDFQLSIESAGNADTAFRLGVLAPLTDDAPRSRSARHTSPPPARSLLRASPPEKPPLPTPSAASAEPEIVYEMPNWRYLFDREIDSLRSPAAGRAPHPVPVRLRVARRNPWWFGFRERHQVRVLGLPVTDTLNGGKSGNQIALTAVRWRFLPFPSVFLIPILLTALLLLSGGAEDLSVSNSLYADAARSEYWVFTPTGDKKEVNLAWKASALAFLTLYDTDQKTTLRPLMRGSGQYATTRPVDSSRRESLYHFRVRRALFGWGSDVDATVHGIFTSAEAPLLVYLGDKRNAPAAGDTLTLDVPPGGSARLWLKNNAPRGRHARLNYWPLRSLRSDGPVQPQHDLIPLALDEDEGTPDTRSLTRDDEFVFHCAPGAKPGDTDQLVIVTTDANRPVLKITLRVAAAQPGSTGGKP